MLSVPGFLCRIAVFDRTPLGVWKVLEQKVVVAAEQVRCLIVDVSLVIHVVASIPSDGQLNLGCSPIGLLATRLFILPQALPGV